MWEESRDSSSFTKKNIELRLIDFSSTFHSSEVKKSCSETKFRHETKLQDRFGRQMSETSENS